MKKPIAILMADVHLRTYNIEQNISIYKQVFHLAKKIQVNRVFHLGDIFDARKSQPLQILNAFGNISRLFFDSDIILTVIPGNHDKVNYESEDSYLDVFRFHPNFELIKNWKAFCLSPHLQINLIPYFKEESIYSKYLDECIQEGKGGKEDKRILLTHIAVNGVKNNDRKKRNNKKVESLVRGLRSLNERMP